MAESTAKQINNYGLMLDALDIAESELEGKPPSEITRIVEAAIAEKGARRDPEARALGLGQTITLGGVSVDVRPLPASRMVGWRRQFVAANQAILNATDYDENPLVQQLELEERVINSRVELLKSYLGDVPESATDAEIQSALEVAHGLAFPFAANEREQLISVAAQRQMKTLIAGLSKADTGSSL